MEVALIGQPFKKTIPIIKDSLQKADIIYHSIIKNKNFNILNMVSIKWDLKFDNYQHFLTMNKLASNEFIGDTDVFKIIKLKLIYNYH